MFQPQHVAPASFKQTHSSGFKDRKKKGDFASVTKENSWLQPCVKVSLVGGLQRPWHKAVNGNSWPWSPQDVSKASAVEDLPRKAVRKWEKLISSFLRKTISPRLCVPFLSLVICLGLGLCSLPVYFVMSIAVILIQLTSATAP